jgi:hypothetical protein
MILRKFGDYNYVHRIANPGKHETYEERTTRLELERRRSNGEATAKAILATAQDALSRRPPLRRP